jgi:hypothetical protein
MALLTANNQSMTAITAFPSAVALGGLVLLATATASDSSTLTFDSDIDDTYKEYVFKFIDMHCAAGDGYFQVNFRDGGSAYDATKTTTYFRAHHAQDDGEAALGYVAGNDVAQGTGVQKLSEPTGNDNDESVSGYLHLFDPSSTTFVKHFHSVACDLDMSDQTVNTFMSGYCNVTAAINGVQFNFSTGNIQSGVIKMYGVT